MPKGSTVAADTRTEEKIYPLDASKYKLLEEVGSGVSAIVYRAQCIPLREYVAIKTLDLDRCNCNLDDVRREAQTMSLINHSNVVKAYCSFVVERSLWVVMPYMAGGSCLHIMKSAFPDGFEEPVIASFLKETLKAIEYLHHQGHIHRDVKAGNILVDGNGVVKLADFGVSACMFDTGDRQRSRKTFVGTPCWMAPEVMEQVNGYDFKADIWSFGITALELAHGHAPFSKYPPMKVLLMTLQNAPPGLDYERDRRFSKSFKEMIAMCLVKDPSRRPSAEKLLKHSFFKQAKSPDYIVRTILGPLPPLWDRVNDLKEKEAARLAQKKTPYNEQEERSQNEYKRGVSSWNFDLEELKNQAALDDTESLCGQTDTDTMDMCRSSVSSSDYDVPFSVPPVTTQFPKGPDAGERVTRVQSQPLPSPSSLQTGTVFLRPEQQSHTNKKAPKNFGRFNVFEDDPDQDTKDLHDSPKVAHENLDAKLTAPGVHEAKQLDTEENVLENGKGQKPEIQYVSSEHHERAAQALDCSDAMREVERLPTSEDSSPLRPIRSTVLPYSISQDNLVQNGASGLPRPNGMGVVQRKGRFSVTSHETDAQETVSVPPSVPRNTTTQASPLHKSASVSDGLERRNMTNSQLALQVFPSGLSATNAMKQLQNLFNQTSIQQDLILGLMSSINVSDQPVEKATVHRSSGAVSKTLSRCNTLGSVDSMDDSTSNRVRDLLSQVAELQCRVATLAEDLQAAKSRNAQLERQLNAIYNKEEEERIRREEAAASDDG